jgi:hypothetical protein
MTPQCSKIIQDHDVGANLVVLLIVKLNAVGQLLASAHTYLPDGSKYLSVVESCDRPTN